MGVLDSRVMAAVHDTLNRCCDQPQCPYEDDEVRRVTEAVLKVVGPVLDGWRREAVEYAARSQGAGYALNVVRRERDDAVSALARVQAWCDDQDALSKGETVTTAAVRAAIEGSS